MYFEFEHPYTFFLLFVIICIYLCPFSPPKRYFVHLQFFSNFTHWFNKEKFIFSIIIATIITALASPISYKQKSPNHRKGRDLVIVLDTSGSMGESGYNAEQKSSRKFDEVKKILNNFILHRFDDNMGIVVFGTFAFATAPLTYDRKSLSYVLKFIDVAIAGENTAIGDGIAQGVRVLDNGNAQKKVIILLSDGYQNSGEFSVKDSVNLSKKKNIKIYTIGLGKSSEFDKDLLKKIAKESKGKFFQAKDSNELKSVYDEINSLEPSPIRSEHYLHKNLLFDIPLFISISLLIYILIKRKEKLI